MNQLVLSVGIPSYNISEYVHACLDSFLKVDSKWYNQFELIFVNDGSKDNTVATIEDYVKNQAKLLNIRLINKENGGHGSAVNRGIQEAKGRYYLSLDGDDWVDPLEFEKLLGRLSSETADVVFTDFTEQHIYNDTTLVHDYSQEFVEDTVKPFEQLQKPMPMHSVIYKHELLKKNHIQLTEGIFYVDNEYILYPFSYAKDFVYYHLNVYQYLVGRPEQSMNGQNLSKNSSHFIKVLDSMFSFCKKNNQLDNRFLLQIVRALSDRYIQISYLYDRKAIAAIVDIFKSNKISLSLNLSKTSKLILLNYRTSFLFDWLLRSTLEQKVKEHFIL